MCGNSDLMEPAGHGQACRDWLYHSSLGHGGRGDPWLGESQESGRAGLRYLWGRLTWFRSGGSPKR